MQDEHLHLKQSVNNHNDPVSVRFSRALKCQGGSTKYLPSLKSQARDLT